MKCPWCNDDRRVIATWSDFATSRGFPWYCRECTCWFGNGTGIGWTNPDRGGNAAENGYAIPEPVIADAAQDAGPPSPRVRFLGGIS